jgi:RNA polymerase sigma-70 factor (ECF subfamily)
VAESPATTDAEMVASTLAGQREAFKGLVGRYQGHVYGLAYSLVGDWADAQDIAQETFIRAYVNLDQIRDAGRFAAWLRRVAFSVAMNWLKAFRPGLFEQLDGRVDLDRLDVPDFQPGPPELAERRELADAVLAAVASLPAKYRIPLTMFHLDGLSYQKVADFLDIPLGTAKSIIHRAKAKLKAALPVAIAKEMTPMVQEVFEQHKLPEGFAGKVLAGVPALGWGRKMECTFAGALASALAATEHPCSYTDLMGFSGLAFRVRWYHGKTGARWCASSPVGELPEETDAVEAATGWRFRQEWHWSDPKMGRFAPDVAAAIDAGKAVLVYAADLNVGVAYGYDEGGKQVLMWDYGKGDEPAAVPLAKLGPMLIFLDEHVDPLPRRDAVLEGLKIAVKNWSRDPVKAPRGKYHYGRGALDAWSEDIARAGTFTDEDRAGMFHPNWWNFTSLEDARWSAVKFLTDGADVLAGDAARAVRRAAALYRQEAELLTATLEARDAFLVGRKVEDWTEGVRRREQEILAEVRQIESDAIAEIERALAAD